VEEGDGWFTGWLEASGVDNGAGIKLKLSEDQLAMLSVTGANICLPSEMATFRKTEKIKYDF
jgi:hypothetical protein